MHVLCVPFICCNIVTLTSVTVKDSFCNHGWPVQSYAGRIHYVKFSLGHEHLEHLRMLFTRLRSAMEFFMYNEGFGLIQCPSNTRTSQSHGTLHV